MGKACSKAGPSTRQLIGFRRSTDSAGMTDYGTQLNQMSKRDQAFAGCPIQ